MTYSTLLGEKGDSVYDRCLAIRIAVFVDEQKFTMEDELDEKDEASDHLLLVDTLADGTTRDVGTIRWWPIPGKNAGKMGRVAVVQSYRGKGVGRVLIDVLEDHLRKRQGKAGQALVGHDNVLSIAHAQAYAQGFYEKSGYSREGEPFLEDGADHVKMTRTVQLDAESSRCQS
ncbi:GNAT family N-acetyltransferase [Sporobolomyces koalae]|uniref:GNAT family N-acetyltransferase n=1 Tax=Sporobolomyces koalae TaxID=500713 RepID=UPI00316B4559